MPRALDFSVPDLLTHAFLKCKMNYVFRSLSGKPTDNQLRDKLSLTLRHCAFRRLGYFLCVGTKKEQYYKIKIVSDPESVA